MPNLFRVAAAKIRKVSKYILIVLDSKCLGSLESIVSEPSKISKIVVSWGFFLMVFTQFWAMMFP
jgi:hypothetical protein